MTAYELRYRRWHKGVIGRGQKGSFRFTILAKTDRDALRQAQAEWDRLMRQPAHMRPEFAGLLKMVRWTPAGSAGQTWDETCNGAAEE